MLTDTKVETPRGARKPSPGRPLEAGVSVSVYRRGGEVAGWRVRLPLLGPDGLPTPRAPRPTLFLPLSLSLEEATDVAQALLRSLRRQVEHLTQGPR